MYIAQWSSSRIFLVHENESIYKLIKKNQTAKVPLSFILLTDSKQIQASTGVKTAYTLYVLLAPKISNIFSQTKTTHKAILADFSNHNQPLKAFAGSCWC